MVTADKASPQYPEAAWRLIVAAIDAVGCPARRIADCSEGTVSAFSLIAPELKGHDLTDSTLSLWRHRKVKRIPRREKLIVLKLTLLCLGDPLSHSWSDAQRRTALQNAVEFADEVWKARDEDEESRALAVMIKGDARYARTVEMLSEYGERLLRQVGVRSRGEAEAKLAVLHQLNGDSDDARYWSVLAAAVNPAYKAVSSQKELFSTARRFAAGYERVRDREAARMYLVRAAGGGDGDSAYQLGQMAELEGDVRVAVDWYRRAADYGHPDGRLRAESLMATF
ncbi:hypothetical protein DP939_31425 [Spongiactinospora rosea]|uniref:Sel1 repeat family protein n=1 Tax=Spongiactinospora rosea TaxID=2248750 RepID=A0A366LS50_9ACTN|nr:sel1 repeat family protein [Spongiactinospora rosea]RBQ16134.1 hypothetical protein DP939_31425 [Spongiactinospora rosea]